ncbi:MAG: NAD(+) synthase [Fastidiosipilaceae bacterium]|jgi:NAD+ synthase (glutamine-hydrolysing)
MKQFGYVLVGTAVSRIRIANPNANRLHIESLAQNAFDKDVTILVFPELSLTGSTCGDLFFQRQLLRSAWQNCVSLAKRSADWPGMLIFVGLPVLYREHVFNCAAAIKDGQVLALIPKTYIPNTQERYERRWFTSGTAINQVDPAFTQIDERPVPFGQTLIELSNGAETIVVGAEVGEDLWGPAPISNRLALEGAQLIVNLSAEGELVGKSNYRRELVSQQSARLDCAYLYAGAGSDESTTDMVYGGHSLIAENGDVLAERKPFAKDSDELTLAVVDTDLLSNQRRQNSGFAQEWSDGPRLPVIQAGETAEPRRSLISLREIDPHPFIQTQKDDRDRQCAEVLAIQAHGLSRRLRHIHSTKSVIGVSGGLDSTLALLATREAYRINQWPMEEIIGVTMPGFGTTDRTYTNALNLMQELGVTIREISISSAVRQHFIDIGHDIGKKDITYENSQARERTQILMDIANQLNGLVIGTGDLSELALGWCTYNGDQMSMYGLNGSVPKTLIRHIVNYVAENESNPRTARLLMDILDTPISPELLPPDEKGEISQHTESSTGPYELHDFFIFNSLKYGYTPQKIYALASRAFSVPPKPGAVERTYYDDETILKWLRAYYRRFFNQQFKRSAMPDGPKVGSVSLSPRTDWRMPSDADSELWLKSLEEL